MTTEHTQDKINTVEVDISALEAGTMTKVKWQGKPVFIVRRTSEQLAALRDETHLDELRDPNSEQSYEMDLPEYCQNSVRARADHEDVAVLIGVCPHAACKVVEAPADTAESSPSAGGFYCRCHRSSFDLAGRVYKKKASTRNLDVPRHSFQTPDTLIIGLDEDGEA